ncbi:MAG: DUF523 domain-containing protein [Marinibacterium sp.]|nr:DUF523 domain-containing protein [Marinibacterium sp.]
MTVRILMSACLLGAPVRYDGGAKTLQHELIRDWQRRGWILPICPEVAAGLPTPRPPAEIAPGCGEAEVFDRRARIQEKTGADVSAAFYRGADLAVAQARRQGCRFALLMDGSPSCGSSFVHAGHHDGRTRPGSGVVTAALRAAGIEVFAPAEIARLAQRLRQSGPS